VLVRGKRLKTKNLNARMAHIRKKFGWRLLIFTTKNSVPNEVFKSGKIREDQNNEKAPAY